MTLPNGPPTNRSIFAAVCFTSSHQRQGSNDPGVKSRRNPAGRAAGERHTGERHRDRANLGLPHRDNKRATGPLRRFAQMINGPLYQILLGHRSHEIKEVSRSDNEAVFAVTVTSQTGAVVGYRCSVAKVAEGANAGAWMTTEVSPPILSVRPSNSGTTACWSSRASRICCPRRARRARLQAAGAGQALIPAACIEPFRPRRYCRQAYRRAPHIGGVAPSSPTTTASTVRLPSASSRTTKKARLPGFSTERSLAFSISTTDRSSGT
jgi:hypothetical protein